MKLFSRSKSDPAAAAATAPPTPGAAASPTPTAQAGAPPLGTGAPPAATEFVAAIDNSVKEMSEKIARLTSSVETAHGERQSFEDKLLRMEERMRKLGALTEMISNQYNPFIGDEPVEGLDHAQPGSTVEAASVTQVHHVGPNLGPEPAPSALPAARTVPWPEAAEAEPLELPEAIAEAAPEPEPEPPVPAAPPAPEPAAAPPAPSPAPAPASPLFTPVPGITAPPAPPGPWGQNAGLAHLDRIAPTFENHLVTLNWANLLLRHLSYDGLLDILTYYESLGWISRDVKRQILTYAEGITPPNGPRGSDEWRGNVELHQKSLLFIERLRGLSVDDESYRTLKREINRIAGEDRRA